MVDFTSKRNIEQVKIPPGHPSANNVETVMKPLGKAVKIGHLQNKDENETLNSFLINYRDTPHLSTGVAPAHMLFRDGYRSSLPHQSISDKIVSSARETDINIKTNRKLDYNSMQNVKNCNFKIGDEVLVRNYQKTSKYDPLYLPKKFVISDIVAKGNIIIVKDLNSSFYLKRHPNDLKHVNQNITFNEKQKDSETENCENELWKNAFDYLSQNIDYSDESVYPQVQLRRSQRIRKPNPKYFNSDYVMYEYS